MKSEGINKLNSRRVYLNEWLDQHKKAQEVVPFVQRNLEFTEWEIEALNNTPDEADKIPLPDLSAKLDQENKFIKKAFPMIPAYDMIIVGDATAVSTSSSTDVYAFVSSVGDIGTPKAVEYSETYTAKYQELQSAHKRSDQVRRLLSGLTSPETTVRFDRASHAYNATRAGTAERTSAANEIRNLLYGVKGDLFKKARSWPNENMTWKKMANRLSKGRPGSTEHQQVLDQATNHSHLIGRLSDISKDREAGSTTNLDNVWAKVLDHLFIVLTLVKI